MAAVVRALLWPMRRWPLLSNGSHHQPCPRAAGLLCHYWLHQPDTLWRDLVLLPWRRLRSGECANGLHLDRWNGRWADEVGGGAVYPGPLVQYGRELQLLPGDLHRPDATRLNALFATCVRRLPRPIDVPMARPVVDHSVRVQAWLL